METFSFPNPQGLIFSFSIAHIVIARRVPFPAEAIPALILRLLRPKERASQ
jgi:hypothetical protein